MQMLRFNWLSKVPNYNYPYVVELTPGGPKETYASRPLGPELAPMILNTIGV